MSESMGSVIRRLRRERGMTQEELAERLNVSAPAVSKWENETSMPDISQVVPLASVFGVSTDSLFGFGDRSTREDALSVLTEAGKGLVYGELDTYLAAYDRIIAGLARYPDNPFLLLNAMEFGLSLCLKENGWLYAGDRADAIAKETERQANLILHTAKAGQDALQARQALILLYTERGEYDRAASVAREFPIRSDLTQGSNLAYVDMRRGEYEDAAADLCTDLDYVIQHMEDDAARLGQAYLKSGKPEEAEAVYEILFEVLRAVYRDECPWRYHDFDSGDCYFLLAEAYLASGKREEALDVLENAVLYEERFCEVIRKERSGRTPGGAFHRSTWVRSSKAAACLTFASPSVYRVKLLAKFDAPFLDPLRDDPRFAKIREKAERIASES